MSQAGILNIKGGGGGNVQTLTANTGGAVSPTGNNINVVGSTLYTVTGNPGTSTLTINPLVNAYPVTPYVVGPVGAAGYQTIQSAVNAANSAGNGIVVVQPGTYTENLTLFNGIHIMGLQFADAGGGVNIIGTHIPPTFGGFCFQYVSLSSPTAIFSSAVAGTAHLILGNAAINITNGYTFNLPNWTGKLESFDVNAAIGTSDGYINNSGGSTIAIFECSIGSATSNVMTISGPYFVDGIAVYCPINFITGSSLFSDFSTYNNHITISNNTNGYLRNCTFTGGTSAAITMSSSGSIELSHAIISSSNNPAIAGAGSGILTYEDIIFLSNANFAGTLTLNTKSWQPYSRAIASTDGTKVGTSAFNSAQFTVDANGFVSLSNVMPFAYTQINHASSPYTVLSTDFYISADSTAGTITVLLPNSPILFRQFIIKDRTGKASSNNISITTVGGAVTIDGQTTYTMAGNYDAIELLWNGTSYEIF